MHERCWHSVPLVTLALACAAHDFRISASVTSAACPGKAARPVAGANVAMDCPQVIKASAPSLLGKTDGAGQFVLEEPLFGRWLHDGCELVVSKPGFETRHIPVAMVCEEYSANHCTNLVVSAELMPEGACR